MNERMEAVHIRIDKQQDLYKLKGSKYVQSDISKIYTIIVDDIKNPGISKVLLFGTPCQIAGVKSFLQRKCINLNNFYCVDLICHGVPSPKLFADYVSHCYKDVKNFNFRDKTFGWSSHIESIQTKNWLTHSHRFAKLFYSEFIIRKSCYQCRFCTYDRIGDLSCGDFWNYKKSSLSYDPDGISEVLINSPKGLKLFNEIRERLIFERILKDQADQYNLNAPTKIQNPSMRDAFWREYRKDGIDYILKKYAKESFFDRARLKLFYYYKIVKRKFKNGSNNDF